MTGTAPHRSQLHDQQLADVLAVLAERPGLTAYEIGISVTDPAPPLTLTLGLLRELEAAGKVYAQPDPNGQRWYLTRRGDAGD